MPAMPGLLFLLSHQGHVDLSEHFGSEKEVSRAIQDSGTRLFFSGEQGPKAGRYA